MIAIDSLIYSSRLALRKNYVFKHISPLAHMLYGSFFSLLFIICLYVLYPETVLKPNDINGFKKIGFSLIIIQIAAFLNYLLYLNLIDKNEISYLIPINQLFVIIFTSMIGVLFLGEKISSIKITGILLGCISIYLINY